MASRKASAKRGILPLAPFLVVGAGAGLLTAWVERNFIGASGAAFELPFIDRLLIAGRVPWFYAAKVLWPVDLIFMYPHWKIDAAVWWQWLYPLALVALVAALLWLARAHNNLWSPRRRTPVYRDAVPRARLSQRLPLPLFLRRRSFPIPRLPRSACAPGRIADESLPPHARRHCHPAPRPRRTHLSAEPRLPRQRNALAHHPRAQSGMLDGPQQSGQHPGQRRPRGDAIASWQSALRIEPNIVEAETSLGNTLFKLPGRQPEALEHLQKALLIDNRYADAHYNLGVALAALPGQEVEAVHQFEEALRYGADNAEVRANLGSALLRVPGRQADAMARYREAVELEPRSAAAHNNLALALARDPARAKSQRLSPNIRPRRRRRPSPRRHLGASRGLRACSPSWTLQRVVRATPRPVHVLNSMFLHECVEAGLDAAIVHAARILPLNKIDEHTREVCLDLIYDRRHDGYDPLSELLSIFDGVSADAAPAEDRSGWPVEQRLEQRIVDGDRNGLEVDLEEALAAGHGPLVIVNDFLLAGMKTVGELFATGEMQLPFVLQSAETMKSAVAFLEPKMEKADQGGKATIVLATVKGDVHDIGKNLVDIILTNNGYDVVNLGIKVGISEMLQAVKERSADAIGMSGLLVKSTLIMRENLEEMDSATWPTSRCS